LFNWLAPHIRDARCLDLFAGSGALGLEALSRGAGHCTFVDSSREVTAQIQQHLQTLAAADRALCRTESAETFLAKGDGPWDIVFLDPPFGQDLIAPCCELLVSSGCLARESLVYIETARAEPFDKAGENWELFRHKHAGNVSYQLFVVHAR
jgi:16S rRNA (guanine966-N2)-methyltransferase